MAATIHRAGTSPSKTDGRVEQQTRLHKRGNVYYFRARTPLNIQHLYAPQTEIKFSLRTASLKEAKALVNQFSVKYDAEFDLQQQALESRGGLTTSTMSNSAMPYANHYVRLSEGIGARAARTDAGASCATRFSAAASLALPPFPAFMKLNE